MSELTPVLDGLTDEHVQALGAVMAELPQVYMPVQHFIGHGLATRVVFIPAGSAVIGHKHRYGQHNHLLQGTLRVRIGDTVQELTAPEVIVSPPGTQRIAVALTDVVWSTTVITEETDPARIFESVLDLTDNPALPESHA